MLPADVIAMIDRFSIEESYLCLATNRTVTSLIHLFKPQVAALLRQRDETLRAWTALHPDRNVYEDRELEITSIIDVDIDRQIEVINKAARKVAGR